MWLILSPAQYAMSCKKKKKKKVSVIPPGIEPGTLSVLDSRDNRYTTESLWLVVAKKQVLFKSVDGKISWSSPESGSNASPVLQTTFVSYAICFNVFTACAFVLFMHIIAQVPGICPTVPFPATRKALSVTSSESDSVWMLHPYSHTNELVSPNSITVLVFSLSMTSWCAWYQVD